MHVMKILFFKFSIFYLLKHIQLKSFLEITIPDLISLIFQANIINRNHISRQPEENLILLQSCLSYRNVVCITGITSTTSPSIPVMTF